jgi:hypothetical protein
VDSFTLEALKPLVVHNPVPALPLAAGSWSLPRQSDSCRAWEGRPGRPPVKRCMVELSVSEFAGRASARYVALAASEPQALAPLLQYCLKTALFPRWSHPRSTFQPEGLALVSLTPKLPICAVLFWAGR